MCAMCSALRLLGHGCLHPGGSDYKGETWLLYRNHVACVLGLGTFLEVLLHRASHWIYKEIMGSWEERPLGKLGQSSFIAYLPWSASMAGERWRASLQPAEWMTHFLAKSAKHNHRVYVCISWSLPSQWVKNVHWEPVLRGVLMVVGVCWWRVSCLFNLL